MSGAGAASALLVVTTAAFVLAACAAGRRQAVLSRLVPARGGSASRVPAALLPATPGWWSEGLAETALPVEPGVAWRAWLGSLVLAVCAAVVLAGPGATIVCGAAAAAVPVVVWRLLRHRGEMAYDATLPLAVEAVAAALRSGASLRQALAEAAGATKGAVGADLALVVAAVNRGATVVNALEGWAARRPRRGVHLVVAALCVGAEAGGARAQAVDGVAATLRFRLAADAEARALGTQARASAAVIASAPVAFCVLAAVSEPRASSFLFRTPVGLLFLSGGLALDATGALWMGRLTRTEP